MSFTAWRTRRIHRQQKQKALQMLAISGVVRPSDVEMRYSIPLIKISGTHTTPEVQAADNERMAPSRSECFPPTQIQRPHQSRWTRHELPAMS